MIKRYHQELIDQIITLVDAFDGDLSSEAVKNFLDMLIELHIKNIGAKNEI